MRSKGNVSAKVTASTKSVFTTSAVSELQTDMRSEMSESGLQTPTLPQQKQEPVRPATQKKQEVPGAYGVTFGNIKGLKNEAKEKLEAVSKQKVALEINDGNLKEAWGVLLDEITREKVIYKNAIQQGKIVHQAGEISIHVSGIALEFLRNHRIKLLDYFKQFYHNEEINVVILEKIPEKQNSGITVLSSKEIYEKMAAQNPALKRLKDSLGMDFEY